VVIVAYALSGAASSSAIAIARSSDPGSFTATGAFRAGGLEGGRSAVVGRSAAGAGAAGGAAAEGAALAAAAGNSERAEGGLAAGGAAGDAAPIVPEVGDWTLPRAGAPATAARAGPGDGEAGAEGAPFRGESCGVDGVRRGSGARAAAGAGAGAWGADDFCGAGALGCASAGLPSSAPRFRSREKMLMPPQTRPLHRPSARKT
jgi:hypothetical protein